MNGDSLVIVLFFVGLILLWRAETRDEE